MKSKYIFAVLFIGLFIAVLVDMLSDGPAPRQIWKAYRNSKHYAQLEITYPLDGAVFPPEIVVPTFRWKDTRTKSDTWLVRINFGDKNNGLSFIANRKQWTPSEDEWTVIKRRSQEIKAVIHIIGINQAEPKSILSAGNITIRTSKDEVGAPLFYREVNLPFIDAVTDPSNIRWRFGEISSRTQPPIILENLPVCGNCHSFSADGSVMGMDVDYANDKGSYAIANTAPEMVLNKDKLITWNDYKKEDETSTFGLLSQISPDGRHVISTVKDRSVFVARPDLAYSQLFFPIRGILAVHNRESGEFHSLPGADDPRFVQSNATWSPDGKTIVFARNKAHPLKTIGNDVLLTEEECAEFLKEDKTFLFDLYQIPFNEGKGGQAKPIKGASKNGKSNFFAKYSPDGKWIVFCKARSFMLLQKDSGLYIMPAHGGEARRMRCNNSQMNSWHSWSPNSKWLVFSSKENGPYTQLWLTHIDSEGNSSPPVVLDRFTSSDRAANIPEFVNVKPGAISEIRQQFLDDVSFVRAGQEFLKSKAFNEAEQKFFKALEINPDNSDACDGIATVLAGRGQEAEAMKYLRRAVELDPESPSAHNNLGILLRRQGKFKESAEQHRRACEINPYHGLFHLNLANAHLDMGETNKAIECYRKTIEVTPSTVAVRKSLSRVLQGQGKLDEVISCWKEAIVMDPKNIQFRLCLGAALAEQRKFDMAVMQFRKALVIDPDDVSVLSALAWMLATCPEDSIRDGASAVTLAEQACRASGYKAARMLDTLAAAYAEAGRFPDAVAAGNKALSLAVGKQSMLAKEIREHLACFKTGKPYRWGTQ